MAKHQQPSHYLELKSAQPEAEPGDFETKDTKDLSIIELKAGEDDDGTRTIEGYASVYNNVDSYDDIIMPGAFAKTLKGTDKIPMLWQHSSGQVLGYFDVFEDKKKGLYVKGPILDTTLGNDVYKLVKAGAIKGMSIGYRASKYEIDEKTHVRKLTEIDLFEVSLVTFPANAKAQVVRVKNQLPKTLREFEGFLREAGFDREQATTIALNGFKSLDTTREADDLREADDQEAVERVSNLLKQFKTTR